MTFGQAQAYLLGTINETASRRLPHRLDRMRALLAALGDPQDRYPTVHVGGTSGKGSTATMIAAMLSAAGKRVGLHTKPHLSSVTERARIDGLPISNERFGELLGEMMPAIERVARDHGRASYYETLLAIAFLYFAQEGVDVAVIEVGVGGRLDGTNVLVPQVSIITNVALDHTDILGDTPALIAADKVGIAKPGVPLVSDVTDPDARAVIEAGTREAGSPFISVRDEVIVTPQAGARYGQSFAVTTPVDHYEIALPVLGSFQQRNAATAIRAAELLPPGLRPDREAVESGLARLVVPGRMEFHPAHPSVIFDIAHNPDKATNLCRALLETFPGRRFAFVIALTQTKDASATLAPFAKMPGTFTFTSFETAGRVAIRPQRLASIAGELGIWGRALADPVDAFSVARRGADASDIVVVTGSTFVVATLRDWWFANVASSV
ncbi:MAG: folylpolyglutamate synthase/dihydrofolate synthase family protein [Candidatus Velthaea sp.]|jgi:dihydrofolate synthase/folylpolyglutamate synthase